MALFGKFSKIVTPADCMNVKFKNIMREMFDWYDREGQTLDSSVLFSMLVTAANGGDDVYVPAKFDKAEVLAFANKVREAEMKSTSKNLKEFAKAEGLTIR